MLGRPNTMRGHWRYLEHDWVAKPGTFIYEPAGEAHTLVITEDSPEPAVIMFVVEGGLIYLDRAVNGSVAAYEDAMTYSSPVRFLRRSALRRTTTPSGYRKFVSATRCASYF
jgi:hypothetical protein